MPNRRTSVALEQARALLPDLESTGLPIAAYCRERGISSWAMYKAARERRAESSSLTAGEPSLGKVAIIDASARAATRPAPLKSASRCY